MMLRPSCFHIAPVPFEIDQLVNTPVSFVQCYSDAEEYKIDEADLEAEVSRTYVYLL